MINSSYRNKSCRFASTMDTGRKKFCRFHGFRVQGSGFRVQGCGGGFAANIYRAMPEGRREEVRCLMSNARRPYELPLSSYRQPPCGNAIKLSGRTFLAPHRGSSPKGLCKRTGFLGVKRRENPVRLQILPSALPPKGEARRYVANDFLNLIALPLRGIHLII